MRAKKRRKIMSQITRRINLRGLSRIQVEWQQDYGNIEEVHEGVLDNVSDHNVIVNKKPTYEYNTRYTTSYVGRNNVKRMCFSIIGKNNKITFSIWAWKDALPTTLDLLGEILKLTEQQGTKLDKSARYEENLKNDSDYIQIKLGSKTPDNTYGNNNWRTVKKKQIFFLSTDYKEPDENEEEDEDDVIEYKNMHTGVLKEEPREKETKTHEIWPTGIYGW